MKKTFITLIFSALAVVTMAGGIVTNTNQSASFIRNPAQDATLGVEATYFNPAGLALLKDGFHLSLNNQFITQTRNIKTTYPGLNQNEFEGGVVAPFFPSFYAAYKMDKFAFSIGFNPIGGGGSALFEDGLPSFEMSVAGLPPLLSGAGIPTTAYSYDTEFEGKSVMFGYQANASYQINDMFAVSLGVRYVTVDNSYKGYLNDIQINPMHPINPAGAGQMTSAPGFFSLLSAASTGAATLIQPLITAGAGAYTLDQLVAAGQITAAQAAQMAGGLGAAYNPSMNVATIQGAYTVQAATMNGYSLATSDKEVDATQSGSGIVPIIGINVNFSERLNIGFKYEHKASITVVNETKVDDVGMYPDGAEVPSDLPSMFAVGVDYGATDKLRINAGFHMYMDKGAEYGKKINGEYVTNDLVIDNNLWEGALGLEYSLNDKWLVSVGYLHTQTGVMDIYQTDLSHSLSTNSFAGGFRFLPAENIGINVGIMNTSYVEYVRDFAAAPPYPAYAETYNRKAFTAALGIDFSF